MESRYFTAIKKLYDSSVAGYDAVRKFVALTINNEARTQVKAHKPLCAEVCEDTIKAFSWAHFIQEAQKNMPLLMCVLIAAMSHSKYVLTRVYA